MAISKLYVFPAICVSLSAWQLYRLRHKNALINRLQSSLFLPPHPLSLADLSSWRDWGYRQVTLRGKYHHNAEVWIGPRALGAYGPGWLIYTPFEIQQSKENKSDIDINVDTDLDTDIGSVESKTPEIVMVNRGWVPIDHARLSVRRDLASASGRAEEAFPEDVTEITGLLRDANDLIPHQRFILPDPAIQSAQNQQAKITRMPIFNLFQDEEERKKRDVTKQWLWMDVGRIKTYLDSVFGKTLLGDYSVSPFIIEYISATPVSLDEKSHPFEGVPLTKEVSLDGVKNKHLGYAITWATLSVFMTAMIYLNGRRRGTPPPKPLTKLTIRTQL